MKAVVIDEWGGSPAIRDIPTPEPQSGDVLIRVQAAGVNPFEGAVRMGISKDTLERLGQLVEKGRLRVLSLTCLPLEEAPQALEQYRSGHVRGKIILLPSAAS